MDKTHIRSIKAISKDLVVLAGKVGEIAETLSAILEAEAKVLPEATVKKLPGRVKKVEKAAKPVKATKPEKATKPVAVKKARTAKAAAEKAPAGKTTGRKAAVKKEAPAKAVKKVPVEAKKTPGRKPKATGK